MKVRGTCVYAERRQSRTGGKYWRVGLKGEDGQARFFNTSSFSGRLGDVVTIEVSEAEWKKAMGGKAAAVEEAEKEAARGGRELMMVKMSALRAAVDFTAYRTSQEWKPEDILALAERFVEWLVAYLPPIEPEFEPPEEEEVVEL